jgi:hypothetical protein
VIFGDGACCEIATSNLQALRNLRITDRYSLNELHVLQALFCENTTKVSLRSRVVFDCLRRYIVEIIERRSTQGLGDVELVHRNNRCTYHVRRLSRECVRVLLATPIISTFMIGEFAKVSRVG